MKKSAILLSKITGIAAAALLLGTSAFADSRPLFATVSVADQGRDYDRRDHDRRNVSVEGRVTRITREREGYRVELDRGGYSFWVRDLNAGGHGHGALRIGINVRMGGFYEPRYGYVVADSYDWLDQGPVVAPGYRAAVLIRGRIDRINRREETLWLRLDDGRMINVDMTRNDRHWNNRRVEIDDLHRGDRVTLSGSWTGRNLFLVNHVEGIRR
ncbi:MAG TPA: hypothetical protein VGJ82_12665 [Thermoanaerobaculia bacterium]|jgi:hypothetical protein